MKILIAHNEYAKRSGEEAVVDGMTEMLKGMGHEVAQLRMSTAGMRDSLSGKIKGFVAGIHSPSGIKAMREALRKEKPDVVNVHNLYPFISPAALFECRKAGVPVVMTIHNFRLMCPTGLFMRNGAPCELCLQKGNEWSCIKYNCEHSMLKSVGYAARNAVARHNGAFLKCVDRFACITSFQSEKLAEAGFSPEKLTVIPNSMNADGKAEPIPEKGYVGYCGRISKEKGVDLIIEVARRHPEIPFRLAGAVRDKELVVNLPANVTLVGFVTGNELDAFYKKSMFMVMASRWYEGFPMSILEAARFGRPVVGPDHGGFTEILGKGNNAIGLPFTPGSLEDLEKCVVRLYNDRELTMQLGITARQKLENEYSSEVVSRKWQQLLDDILSERVNN